MTIENNTRDHTRALSYCKAIAEVFYLVFEKKSPLDRELKSYFHRQTECGSKDRAFISDALYSLFRWYGWVGRRLPKHRIEKPLESKKFCLALSAALWLDNQELCDITKIFLDAAGVDWELIGKSPEIIEKKKKGLACFFQFTKLDVLDLVPKWFIKECPFDSNFPEMIESLQRRPPVWLRLQNEDVNIVFNELSERGLMPERHSKIINAIKLSCVKFNVNSITSYQKGLFEVQDLASQCLGIVCQARPGEEWLDVCAGGGGKTLLLADQMKGQGTLIATDTRQWVLKALQKRADRGDFKNIQIHPWQEIISEKNVFDGILIDAPCSSNGTWRRNPDARWTTDKNICQKMSLAQKDILEYSAPKVRAGGVLMYATCSLSVLENEQMVECFLKSYARFHLEDFVNPLTGVSTGGMTRIDFNPDDCDAMFVARFRKNTES